MMEDDDVDEEQNDPIAIGPQQKFLIVRRSVVRFLHESAASVDAFFDWLLLPHSNMPDGWV